MKSVIIAFLHLYVASSFTFVQNGAQRQIYVAGDRSLGGRVAGSTVANVLFSELDKVRIMTYFLLLCCRCTFSEDSTRPVLSFSRCIAATRNMMKREKPRGAFHVCTRV